MAKPKRSRPIVYTNGDYQNSMVRLGGTPRPLNRHAEYKRQQLAAITTQRAHEIVENNETKKVAKILTCGRILTNSDDALPGFEEFSIGLFCRQAKTCPVCNANIAYRSSQKRVKSLPRLAGCTALSAVIRFCAIESEEQALAATNYLRSSLLDSLSKQIARFARPRGGPDVLTDWIFGVHFSPAPTRSFLQPHIHCLFALPDRDHAAALQVDLEQWIATANADVVDQDQSFLQLDNLQHEGLKKIVDRETKTRSQRSIMSVMHYRHTVAYVRRLGEEDDDDQPSQVIDRFRTLQRWGMAQTSRQKKLGTGKTHASRCHLGDAPLAIITPAGPIVREPAHRAKAIERFLHKQICQFIEARARDEFFTWSPLPQPSIFVAP